MARPFRMFFTGTARLRFLGIALVFLLGIAAFAGGVSTTEMANPRGEGLLAWTYYCAALFVLGGLDLGTPAGGPLLAQIALWVAFFLAPTITATALIEAVYRLIRSDSSLLLDLKDHTILVGGGRLARTYTEAIRAVEPQRLILQILESDQGVDIADTDTVANLNVLRADPTDLQTLRRARLDRAREVIVIAPQDLSNLEVGWSAKALAPELPVAVHVTDLTLLRPVNRMLTASSSPQPDKPLVFNTNRIAALHLYEKLLHPHFENTGYRDVVVIGGFGGFAQTILELLIAIAIEELEHVIVVDEAASGLIRQFEADISLGQLRFSTVDGPMEDPDTWSKVDDLVSSMEPIPVYFLASSQEVLNFRTAMLLRRRDGEARIFARCFKRSSFTESLAVQQSFELFAFEEVFREALQDHYRNLQAI